MFEEAAMNNSVEYRELQSANHYRARQNYGRKIYGRKRSSMAISGGPSALFSIVFVSVAILMIVFVAFLVTGGANTFMGFADSGHESTPESDWEKGSMPILYQNDSRWKNHRYAGSSFGESGCGPISLTMAYVYLTGNTQFSPTDIADIATKRKYAQEEGTSWAFMVEGANVLGIQAEEIPFSESTVRDSLEQGNPIICIMGPGDFTSSGHFIVLCGIADDGSIIIRDSNSPERTAKTWSFDALASQCRAAWVYFI